MLFWVLNEQYDGILQYNVVVEKKDFTLLIWNTNPPMWWMFFSPLITKMNMHKKIKIFEQDIWF